jgi:hypothetical protein
MKQFLIQPDKESIADVIKLRNNTIQHNTTHDTTHSKTRFVKLFHINFASSDMWLYVLIN